MSQQFVVHFASFLATHCVTKGPEKQTLEKTELTPRLLLSLRYSLRPTIYGCHRRTSTSIAHRFLVRTGIPLINYYFSAFSSLICAFLRARPDDRCLNKPTALSGSI